MTTAIFKTPVDRAVAVRGVNLAGDDQADRSVHGGVDKAIYAYALEDYRWWENELGQSLSCGQFGENLTTEGVAVNDALIGERWHVGSAVLEIAGPRIPCFKLGIRMNDQSFVQRFARALRPGAYLRIVQEGAIGPEDSVEIVSRPDSHDVSVRDVADIYLYERTKIARLLKVPHLAANWREWAVEQTPDRRREL